MSNESNRGSSEGARASGIETSLRALSPDAIAALAANPATRLDLNDTGELVLRLADGRTIVADGTEPLVQAFTATPNLLLNHLEDNRDALRAVLAQAHTPGTAANAFDDVIGAIGRDAGPQENWPGNDGDFASHGRAATVSDGGQSSSFFNPLSGARTPGIGALHDETGRFGRDDLKRGEAGSAGEQLSTGVGNAIGHLVGLGDEEPGLRNGEKLISETNGRFIGEPTGVGTGLDHLWLLGDTEYYRASTDDRDVDGLLPQDRSSPKIYGPLIDGERAFTLVEDVPFKLSEDGRFIGELFAASDAILPAYDIVTEMDPTVGTVVLNPDGTFVFTPANGYSGKTKFDYSFTDPRTGEKVIGSVDLTVEAVADPALIAGGAVTPEDVPVAVPVTVDLQDPDGSETIAYVEITKVPAGTTLGFSGPVAATVINLPGGGLRLTGDTDDIQAALKRLTFSTDPHISGTFTLDVEVQTIESHADPSVPGYRDTNTVNHPLVVEVVPVADQPPVTGGNFVTDEDTRVALTTLAGSLVDVDGSEVLSFQIAGVDPNAKLEDAAGNELSGVVQADGTKTYTVTPDQIGGVFYNPPPNVHGTDAMTITAVATERANGDRATSTAPITVVINPVDDLPTISGGATVVEDTAVQFGADIVIGPVIDADGSEQITEVVIAGIPAGVVPTGTNVGGATFVFDPGTGTITVTGGTQQDIRDTVATLGLTPPANSDVNINLQVQVTTTDGGLVSSTPFVPFEIQVAASADAPSVSGAAVGDEDQPIALPITASLNDTDGSERYEFADITVPAGVTLSVTSLPAGITQTAIPGGFRFEPGPAVTPAAFEAFLAGNIRVQAPTDSDVDFDATVTVGVIEATLSGGEVALLRNSTTATVPVQVDPVPDLPTITGASAMNEDAITNVLNQAAQSPLNFGANIAITENDKADGSEAITQIVVSGIPEGALVGYAPVGGGLPVIIVGAPGGSTITLNGGTEDEIRAALASMDITPPPNSDADITLGLAVTKTDSGVSATQNGTHTIAVAAVADAPTVSGAAAGLEDQPIALNVTADLTDTDGSETFDFIEVTTAVVGATLSATTLPAGVTQTAIAGGVRFDFDPGVISTADARMFMANNLRVQAPLDSDVNFDVDVTVGTIESTLIGGQVSLLRNETTETVTVDVTPVVDTPTINSNSTVNEDGIANVALPPGPGNVAPGEFGTAIEAGLMLGETAVGDTSEDITQVVITGIPLDATIGTGVVAGATIDTVSVPGQITVTGTDEAAVRAALQTLTLIPGAHKDDDISLGVAVTVRDTDPDDAGDTTSQVFNGTHTIAVAAVADAPTVSGAAAGLEDQPIALNVTADLTDTDGSETFDFIEVTTAVVGATLSATTLPAGVTQTPIAGGLRFDFDPGVISTADARTFIANNLRVQAPLDSDVNFDVDVTVGTIESTLIGGQVSLLRNETTDTITVDVTPVVDTPAINSNSTVNEDGIANVALPPGPGNVALGEFGTAIEAGLTLGETAVGDTSEDITQVVITGIPLDATIGTGVVAGATIDTVSVPGQITVTGTDEATIRAALQTLTLIPGAHKDDDISLGVAVAVRDTDPDDAGDTTSQVFNGTHTIAVAAVADAPIISGSSVGKEDADIPLNVNVALVDTDGSETLDHVIIQGVPDGFTLTETSALGGVLTDTTGGRYVLTGTDAEIQDMLANLTLTIAAPVNARTHLDDDFNLLITAVSEESNPTEGGVGQVARIQNTTLFTHQVVVHAVADPVTHSGSSELVEDTNGNVGGDIVFTKIDTDGSENITEVTVTGFPAGSTVTYEPVGGGARIPFAGATLTLNGGTEAEIRTALASLEIQPPLHSDVDFNLTVTATTTDNLTSPDVADHTETTTWTHTVKVQAVADTPAIVTTNVSGDEDTTIALNIDVDRSADGQTDASEVLSVRITLPQDGGSPIGTIIATGAVVNGVTITDEGNGVYLIEGPGVGTPAAEEAAIDAFLTGGGLALQPRAQFAGSFTGANGIRVDAISTETASGVGDQVAPGAFGGADGTSQTETVTSQIDVVINPIVDNVTFANASTVVDENNASILPSDPDLIVPLGTRLGTQLVDLDGSQSLTMSLANIPATAGVAFGATVLAPGGSAVISGVTVSLDGTGTQIAVDGPNAADVITVLETLNVTLADDDDSNFQVAISGSTQELPGGPAANFNGTHDVIVRATADRPNVNVGSTTKATVDEDSGFVGYPVTIGLNDTDGSETYDRVVVEFSTPGGGARPEVQFGTTTGVTINTATPGQVTLTGGTPAQMEAALASLQVRPGASNGDDITVRVTARSIESNPSEANDTGVGNVGSEIAVPTAQLVRTFVIPVDPVPEVPTLTAPANLAGTEDLQFALAGISISKATPDNDGSESVFLEIDTSSYPAGTVFTAGGSTQSTIVGGFLRIAEADLGTLQMQTPLHYSGTVDLSVRAAIVDSSASNTVTTTTAPQTISVDVVPVADPITSSSETVVIEDAGAVAFGADIAGALTMVDTVVGGPGEGGAETVSQIVLVVPADTPTLTYEISGANIPTVVGSSTTVGTTTIALSLDGGGNRVYTITSSLTAGVPSDANRAQADADIKAALSAFNVAMGPDALRCGRQHFGDRDGTRRQERPCRHA
jgi:hypothetical protein